MKVLVVPDKLKGTLTAKEAAMAIKDGWREVRPQDEVECVPMSDGGDGFGALLGELINAKPQPVSAVDAAGRPITAEWWRDDRGKTAIFETARVNGLSLLPPGQYHPFDLDTCGLAAVFRTMAKHGVSRCIAGIGGSATNDAGFGLGLGLGYEFLDEKGEKIEEWTELDRLARIIAPSKTIAFADFVIATDVQNPLLGPQGASRIYGPQKGLRSEDFPKAEKCLERFAEIAARDLGINCVNEPGTGAAGGLGYGLRLFFNSRFVPGFEIFAQLAGLEEKIRQSELVVTAEGAIDISTRMGKGTGAVARLCSHHKKRCIGLAGVVEETVRKSQVDFWRVYAICPDHATVEEGKARAGEWLRHLAEVAAREAGAL